MSKQVLILLGSPRKKGNTARLAAQIGKGAKAARAKVETIFLQDKRISPCRGCLRCQKPGSTGCVIPDDMQALYPRLLAADAWVVASPVYWFTLSAQTKLFMDRCFAFLGRPQNPFAGKRIAVAMTYGDADPFCSGCVNALRTFQDAYRYAGATLVGMVYGSSGEPLAANAALLEEAFSLGRKLVEEGG